MVLLSYLFLRIHYKVKQYMVPHKANLCKYLLLIALHDNQNEEAMLYVDFQFLVKIRFPENEDLKLIYKYLAFFRAQNLHNNANHPVHFYYRNNIRYN